MKESLSISLETRIDKQLVPLLDEPLFAIAQHYNHAKWSMMVLKNRGEEIDKPSFMKQFGLTSRYYNAIKGDVDGMFQSQESNMARYILEAEKKIDRARERMEEIKSVLPRIPAKEKDKIQKLWNEYRGCHRNIQRKHASIIKWEKLLNGKKISVCAGSRRLFHKQHQLSANGYANHAHWRDDYRVKNGDNTAPLKTHHWISEIVKE